MLMPVGMVESFGWSVPRSISADRCTPFRVSTAWMMRSGIPSTPRSKPAEKPAEESFTDVSQSLGEIAHQVVDGAEDAGWVVINAADASSEYGLAAHPLSDVSDLESDVESDTDAAEEVLEANGETSSDAGVEASVAVDTSEVTDRTTPISQLKTSMKELFSFNAQRRKEARYAHRGDCDAAEVTVDAAEVTTDAALFNGGSEMNVESVEASETSEVDEEFQTEAAIEDTSTTEDTSTHEGIDVDDVIPVADVDNVDVVPDTVVVALEQEGNVEAVTSAVETTTMAPEEKATSSNPLAGVMDRLAALKTKVMEGDSANDEAQIGNETTVSEAT